MKRTKILLNKYIVLIFIISLWHTNIFAYQVSKTPGGADIKWFIPHAIYYINPSGGPTNNLSAIQASMQTWTDVDTSDFTFIYGGTTTNASAGTNDGVSGECTIMNYTPEDWGTSSQNWGLDPGDVFEATFYFIFA